ncbi:MAG: hypothetical protein M1368_03260 [Thaumarchaeota archaeon]|nr:hypothetical protein [Nitrososphaerota archaeon]
MGWLIKQGGARQKAKLLGMVVAFLIIVAMASVIAVGVLHSIHTESSPHKGLYFYVENASLINSSGSYRFITSVKNTGSVFVDTIHITVTETGSMIGTLSSIPVGGTANTTIPVSGVTNNTIYMVEYSATSGNLTYTTTYPVST